MPSWSDWSQTLPCCIAAQRPTTKCQHVASASTADGYVTQGGELNLQGCTPLMLACSKGHGEVVKALLVAGADTSASNPVMFLLYWLAPHQYLAADSARLCIVCIVNACATAPEPSRWLL